MSFIFRVLLGYALLRGLIEGLCSWRRKVPIYRNGRVDQWAWGDGVHDDTPYLQRALNSGGMVEMLPGQLRTNTLTIPTHTYLRGSGWTNE